MILIGIYAEAIVLLDGGRSFFITEYSEERSIGIMVWGVGKRSFFSMGSDRFYGLGNDRSS